MSVSRDELLARHDAKRPDHFVTLPSGVTVYWCRPGSSAVEYLGWPDDLIAAGLMLQEWLQPTGKRLKDQDGDRVTVTRYWRLKDGQPDGQPARYCKVLRVKPMAATLRLPGAALALEALKAYHRWFNRRDDIVRGFRRRPSSTENDSPDLEMPLNVQRDVTQLLEKFKRPQT